MLCAECLSHYLRLRLVCSHETHFQKFKMEEIKTIQLRDSVAKVGDEYYYVVDGSLHVRQVLKIGLSLFSQFHINGGDGFTPSFLTKAALWSYCQENSIECPELEQEFAPKRDAKKFASYLYSDHYSIIFNLGSDTDVDILVTLAIKCAIFTTETLIKENAFDVDFYQSILTELKQM
jgi:hypothetical protein